MKTEIVDGGMLVVEGPKPDGALGDGRCRTEVKRTLAVMMAEKEESLQATGGVLVTDIAAGWLAPEYLVSLYGQVASLAAGPERFALLREAGDVVRLQLAGIWAGRLRVEQEKLEFLRQKHSDEMEAAKQAAAAKLAEANGNRSEPDAATVEAEMKACVDKIDEIMGLKGVKVISTARPNGESKGNI